jgi:hypothetical protein
MWQRGCREENDVHMGVSWFLASVPLRLVESHCHHVLAITLPDHPEFNVWHRRTPQMYIVLESDPSRQDRGANEGIIFLVLCFKTAAQLLGLKYSPLFP